MNELLSLIDYAKDSYHWEKVMNYLRTHEPFDETTLIGASDETINDFISACAYENVNIGNIFNLNFNLFEDTRLLIPLNANESTVRQFFTSNHPQYNHENYTTILFNQHIAPTIRLDLFNQLIQLNPEVQDIKKQDLFEIWFGENMLYYCDSALILKNLVELGIDCHIINESQENLLHFTTDPDMIDYLVSQGVDVNLKNSLGTLPILAKYENVKDYNDAENYWPTIETTQAFIRNGSIFEPTSFEFIFDEKEVEELTQYAKVMQEYNKISQSTPIAKENKSSKKAKI